MGRIKQNIEVGDKKFWALFDTGARNTYITEELAAEFAIEEFESSNPVALGGRSHIIKQVCLLKCKIKGLYVNTNAFVLDYIGQDEEGKKIDVLIGALLMQQWGIIPVPEKEDVDMSHYPREFVEFID